MYYKIIETQENQGLCFQFIAENREQLEAQGYTPTSPYIIEESLMVALPQINGVFTKKLNKEGFLEDLPKAEIDRLQVEENKAKKPQLRVKLLQLSNEIDLAEKLSENTENLYAEFRRIKAEYDAIKNV